MCKRQWFAYSFISRINGTESHRDRSQKKILKKNANQKGGKNDVADNVYLHNTLMWKTQDMLGLRSIWQKKD